MHVRVKDKATGHEYTIPEARFDEAKHTRLQKSPYGRDGLPAAPKYKTTVAKSAAAKKKTGNGQKATDQNEES